MGLKYFFYFPFFLFDNKQIVDSITGRNIQKGIVMVYKTEVNDKPILLRDSEAVILVKQRAKREGRSAANAAYQTIFEHLKKGSQNED